MYVRLLLASHTEAHMHKNKFKSCQVKGRRVSKARRASHLTGLLSWDRPGLHVGFWNALTCGFIYTALVQGHGIAAPVSRVSLFTLMTDGLQEWLTQSFPLFLQGWVNV